MRRSKSTTFVIFDWIARSQLPPAAVLLIFSGFTATITYDTIRHWPGWDRFAWAVGYCAVTLVLLAVARVYIPHTNPQPSRSLAAVLPTYYLVGASVVTPIWLLMYATKLIGELPENGWLQLTSLAVAVIAFPVIVRALSARVGSQHDGTN